MVNVAKVPNLTDRLAHLRQVKDSRVLGHRPAAGRAGMPGVEPGENPGPAGVEPARPVPVIAAGKKSGSGHAAARGPERKIAVSPLVAVVYSLLLAGLGAQLLLIALLDLL